MSRIFTAMFLHETLSPDEYVTSRQDFENSLVLYPDQSHETNNYWYTPLKVWRELAVKHACEIITGFAAHASPSGPIEKNTFNFFCQQILEHLEKIHQPQNRLTGVLLHLHGAMIAQQCDDAEAYLLREIRRIVGADVIISVLMDLHGHQTHAKKQYADVIHYYHQYPHMDLAARATELWNVTQQSIVKLIQPKIITFPTRMLNHMVTTVEPMRSIIQWLEQQVNSTKGIHLLSIAHGFPWADVPESGVTPVAVYDEKQATAKILAEEIIETLGLILYHWRDSIKPQTVSLQEALIKAQQLRLLNSGKPMVLAEYSDNPGGGALGKAVFNLQVLLEKKIPRVALSSLWDVDAVEKSFSAGIGQELELALGGTLDPEQQRYYGVPLKVKVRVVNLIHNLQDEFSSGFLPKGSAVRLSILHYWNGKQWLEQHDVEVIVNTLRAQTFSPQCFTALDIDVARKDFLVVKSMYHYRAAFEKITDPVCVLTLNTPGRLALDFTKITYNKLPVNTFWPVLKNIPEYDQKIAVLLRNPAALFTQLDTFLRSELLHSYML